MASAGGLADEDAIQIELGTVGVRDTAQAQDSTAVLSPASGSDPSSAQGSAASVAEFAEDDAGAGVAPGSSKCGAVTNFVNSIIGAGIIGLPFALREAGLVGGLILILLVGLATDYSVRIVVKKAVAANALDYERVVRQAVGVQGFYVIVFAMFVFAFGALLTYTIILADDVSVVVSHWSGHEIVEPWTRRGVILGVSVACLLPLGLVKNMSTLARTSSLSLLAVVCVILVVVIRAGTGVPDPPTFQGSPHELDAFAPRFFPALGAICFAFVCHHSSMVVFNSLQPRLANLSTWAFITHASIAAAVCCSVVLAVTGYVTFGTATQANLLNNYSLSDELVNVTRIVFALTMLLTYPMEMFVARHCIAALWKSGEQSAPRLTHWQHISVTVVLWLIAMGIALVLDDLGLVLELAGGTSATILGFVMPALLVLRTTKHNLQLWKNDSSSVCAAAQELVPAFALLLFGCVAFVVSTTETIRSAVVSGGSH